MALFYWPGLKLPQSDVLQVNKASPPINISSHEHLLKNHIFWNDFSWFTDQQHFYCNNHDLLQLFTASHPFEQYDLNFRDKFGFEVNIANIVNTFGVRWSLSISYSFSEMSACSVFWHWFKAIGRYRILFQVRKSAEHSLNMPLRYQSWILMSTIF